MTFEEAEKRLAIIARGEYHKLSYSKTVYDETGYCEIECSLYIHNIDEHMRGRTWNEAFDKLTKYLERRQNITRDSEAPGVDA